MNYPGIRATAACALLLFACCRSERQPQAPQPAPHPGLYKLTIGDAAVYVDIARTYPARQQGLMYRKSMPEDEGMLFVYPDSDMRSFWMKNTHIPLSLAYGTILQLVDMQPLDESSHPSEKPAQYVLEVNQGWFEKHGVKVGDMADNLPSPEGAEQ